MFVCNHLSSCQLKKCANHGFWYLLATHQKEFELLLHGIGKEVILVMIAGAVQIRAPTNQSRYHRSIPREVTLTRNPLSPVI